MDMNLGRLQEIAEARAAWRATVHELQVRHDLTTEKNNPAQWKCADISNVLFYHTSSLIQDSA